MYSGYIFCYYGSKTLAQVLLPSWHSTKSAPFACDTISCIWSYITQHMTDSVYSDVRTLRQFISKCTCYLHGDARGLGPVGLYCMLNKK